MAPLPYGAFPTGCGKVGGPSAHGKGGKGLRIDGIICIFFSGYACPLPQNLVVEKKGAGRLWVPTTSVGEGSHACGDPEAAAKMPPAGR